MFIIIIISYLHFIDLDFAQQYVFIHRHGACSSVVLAGFALSECPGLSFRVYPALEDLTVVVHRGLVSLSFPGSTLYVHVCHPRGTLPAPGLAGCPVGRGE